MRLALLTVGFLIVGSSSVVLANHAEPEAESTNYYTDDAPAKPEKPTSLPKVEKKVSPSTVKKINEYGDKYLAAVNTLGKKLKEDTTIKPETAALITRELRLAKAFSDAKGKFVGFPMDDVNEKIIVDTHALKMALTRTWNLTREVLGAEALTVQLTMQRLDQDSSLFVDPQLNKIYSQLDESTRIKAFSDFDVYAQDLTRWYMVTGK